MNNAVMFHGGARLDTHITLVHDPSELISKRTMESAIHNF
jgi:hypothetical protein